MRFLLFFILFCVGCSETKSGCCCCQCPKPIQKTIYVQKPKYTLDMAFSKVMTWLNEQTPATPSK